MVKHLRNTVNQSEKTWENDEKSYIDGTIDLQLERMTEYFSINAHSNSKSIYDE